MHVLIAHNLAALATLCRTFGVRRLEVFGSAARGTDFDTGSSDADFLVEFESESRLDPLHELFGLRTALSELLKRPVDLIEQGAIKNPYVGRQIESSRRLVYAA